MATGGAGGQLVLSRLTKRYPNFLAVDAISLDVAAGEFLTLLGPSGSGKTTTLMMVAGFTPPSDGEIRLNGRSVGPVAPEQRNIGVVFQNYALFPHMTVAENIAFPLRMRRLPPREIAVKVEAALRMVRLDGLGGRRPRQLSGGQQQRVAFARALIFGPDLLLMDEPLGALDKNLRGQMQFELKRLHAELGVTIVYVTHDQEEALTLSDRVALMNRGRIEQLGTAEDLYERPVNRFTAEFIGESNIIEGRLRDDDGEGAWFVTPRGERLPVARDAAARSRDGLLAIRPEKFAMGPPEDAPGALQGEVTGVVYVGDFTRYQVGTAGGLSLTVKMQNSRDAGRMRKGDRVSLRVDPKDARLLAG